ncbi:MAG: hypothetical protein PHP25_04365 [Candidatus Moranbacteria bacterium]|nr:hypothetical protein [Candidatus Moranbacteria bacterium]
MLRQTYGDQIFGKAAVHDRSYVDPRAAVIGTVIIERNVYVAPFASIRADENAPYMIREFSNVQDFVNFHAFHNVRHTVGGKEFANYIGRRCTLAHHSEVHSAVIRENCFLGIRSSAVNSVIGANCYIGHHVLIENAKIPEGRYIASCTHVNEFTDFSSLPEVPDKLRNFNMGVVEENQKILLKYLAEAIRF